MDFHTNISVFLCYFRGFLISFEMLWMVFCVFIYLSFEPFLAKVDLFASQYSPLVIIPLFGVVFRCYKLASEFTNFSGLGIRDNILNWELYRDLKIYIKCAIWYVLISLLSLFVFSIIGKMLPLSLVNAAVICSGGVLFISWVSLENAWLNYNRIIEENK